jgi:hypothetical protein
MSINSLERRIFTVSGPVPGLARYRKVANDASELIRAPPNNPRRYRIDLGNLSRPILRKKDSVK